MNQYRSGQLIAQKRKEKNITQAELAERIGVSNKSVSKWETGKCMPDYSVVEPLCAELGISIGELLNGEENGMSDEAAMRIIERVQALEKQRNTLIGVIVLVMGIAMMALGQTFDTGVSDIRDFFAGLVFGIGIGETLVGLAVTALSMRK